MIDWSRVSELREEVGEEEEKEKKKKKRKRRRKGNDFIICFRQWSF